MSSMSKRIKSLPIFCISTNGAVHSIALDFTNNDTPSCAGSGIFRSYRFLFTFFSANKEFDTEFTDPTAVHATRLPKYQTESGISILQEDFTEINDMNKTSGANQTTLMKFYNLLQKTARTLIKYTQKMTYQILGL